MDNIKMGLLEIGLNIVDWIGMAQDRYRWRALVYSIMNLRVPLSAGNYRMAAQLVASRAVLSSTEPATTVHSSAGAHDKTSFQFSVSEVCFVCLRTVH
jgi:hypothetical protein